MLQARREEAASAIRQSFSILSAESNLSPKNERVTSSLTHLVRSLTQHSKSHEVTQFLLQTPDLKQERDKLPVLCGEAECEMEKFWAKRLTAQHKPRLEDFWYYPEYTELVHAEMALFGGRKFDSISFLGAGALPVTAFLLAQGNPQTKITCVDYDREACDLAAGLAHRLGLDDKIEILCMDALQYVPEQKELVICASLLQTREEVYKGLEKKDCSLIVRDSEGIYQFLYKSAELPEHGFREIRKTGIDSRRINTSRYFERIKNAA